MSKAEDFHLDEAVPVEPGATYTIEMVARITRIPREEIIVYYRSGFVSPVEMTDESRLIFDEQAVHQLRRIAFLLSRYGMNHDGARMIASLLQEMERLRREVRFLREK